MALAVVSLASSLSGEESLSWYKATAGMAPTIQPGQLMGVDQSAYGMVADVRRGDIIVFRFPESPEHLFAMRVVGLPKEEVSLQGGRVAINQVPLAVSGSGETRTERAGKEKYRIQGAGTCDKSADEMPSVQVPEGSFFVLGDSRCASRDSRFWGRLEFSFIVGKVVKVR